jgi:hypothetical protein
MSMSARSILTGLLVLLAALAVPAFPGASPNPVSRNLAANGGFESEELGNVAMWSFDAWIRTDEAVRFFLTTDQKHSGGRSLAIANLQPDDSRALQWIAVKPGTWYRIACWIYAQDVVTPAIGANISVLGTTVAAGNLRDTGGTWQRVELVGKTGAEQRAIAVLARLGFHGSLATGLALFDDFSVEELPGQPAGAKPASLDSTDTLVLQPLTAATPAQGLPLLTRLFTPPLVYIAAAAASLAVAAALVIAAITLALILRRQGVPAASVPSASPGPEKPMRRNRRGLRRRGAPGGWEHRAWNRSPLRAPVTVRRGLPGAAADLLQLQCMNASPGGLFLSGEPARALALDEEVSLEVRRPGRAVELGRARVVRVARDGVGISLAVPLARIRQALQNAS